MSDAAKIAAVVLAAGRSSRMGRPKMALPWGKTTVIGQVVATLAQAGVQEIVVVTGGARAEVEAALAGQPVRTTHNPDYEQDFMLLSIQTGLNALPETIDAALIALGDQPQMEAQTARQVIGAYFERRAALVIPSYQMRRGHPWLIGRVLWPDLLAMRPPETPRSFMNVHAGQIEYVDAGADTILRDLDTPEDYRREQPGFPA